MEYTQLSEAQQKQMLESRLAGLEAEHFNHTVNLTLLEASGDNSDQVKAAIKDAKEAIKVIEQAHEEVSVLVSEIPEDPSDVTPTPPVTANRAARRAKVKKS